MKTIIAGIAFFIMLAAAKTHATEGGEYTLSSAHVIGAYVSYNHRQGFRQFDGLDDLLPTDNTNPIMYGTVFGKRSPTKNPRLRSSSEFEFGYGRVADGSYDVGDVFSSYTTVGTRADMHILFPAETRTHFITLGLGGHMMYYRSDLQTFDDDDNGGTTRSETTFTPSVNIGAGTDYVINAKYGMSVIYNFRFWRSTRYIETGALFPMGVNYREFFYSHSISLQILLPGLEKGGRFIQ